VTTVGANQTHVRRAGIPLVGRRPVDPVLDHAALERVPRDSEQLSRVHDAAALLECLQAHEAFGFAQVEVFEMNRHGLIVHKIELVEKPFFV
jgi:hypothetical protein